MIIGITGSFGSGKTTVANMFTKHGFKVINADEFYHGIYSKDKILKSRIKKEFGTLDRGKIKKIVFNNSSKLKKLNEITHPVVIKALKKEMSTIIKENNKKIPIMNNYNKKNKIKIIIDVPLLFEARMQNMFDKIIVVKCDKKTQIKRLLKKKKYSKKEIGQIIRSQVPIREKIRMADFVVDNDGSLNDAQKQVKSIVDLIQNP